MWWTIVNTLPNPLPAHIPDDDLEVRRVLTGISKPVVSISEIITSGPHGRSTVYRHIREGLLTTFVSCGRRYAFAIDFARYLVALRRIGETDRQRHTLAKPENRPRHDPKRLRFV